MWHIVVATKLLSLEGGSEDVAIGGGRGAVHIAKEIAQRCRMHGVRSFFDPFLGKHDATESTSFLVLFSSTSCPLLSR